MSFSIQYKELFRVDFLHRFYLDKGNTGFESMDETSRKTQLKNYDFRSFLTVSPSLETLKQLNGYNLVFRQLNTGITLWSKVDENDNNLPFVLLPADLDFTFLIHIKDSSFLNYTDLKLENAGRLYYLSNRKKATEPSTFPLIDKAGSGFYTGDNFVLSDDGQKEEFKQLLPADKMRLFGLIRIFVKGDTTALNITTTQDKIPVQTKVFEVMFKNRNTVWRYLFGADQQVAGSDDVIKENGNSKILIAKTEHPLTRTGFISIKLGGAELPNPGTALIRPNVSDNTIYSEIYM